MCGNTVPALVPIVHALCAVDIPQVLRHGWQHARRFPFPQRVSTAAHSTTPHRSYAKQVWADAMLWSALTRLSQGARCIRLAGACTDTHCCTRAARVFRRT